MFNEIKKQIEWNGEILELSTGKIARQADGAVIVKMGNTMVQCTVVAAKEAKDGADFFPLTVNYQEKSHSAGKIPGGFFKREGKGGEKEVLTSRLIDRPIRPLFHEGFFNETQILCTVHSFDSKHNPDILALIGASAALAISGLPYKEIVAASRVAMIDNQYVINPTLDQLDISKLDLVVAGTSDSVMMVESEAEFLTEKQMLDAVKLGHESFQPVINLIKELKQEAGKEPWEVIENYPQELKDGIRELISDSVNQAFSLKVKQERYAAVKEITNSVIEKFTADEQYTEMQVNMALSDVKSDILRQNTLKTKKRIDGRAADEIRPIVCETSILPNAHGSSLFTRGETQALVAATLGTGQDEQIMDGIEGEYKESFLLNYIFPQYSVGEVGPLRAPSRREIGHGKLAWRALKRAIPQKTDFPYTVRVVSEITESNGSSSMATVCGGSMSMMDAGVPLKTPIAGIAMGLIKDKDQFMVLSDIIADEDHLGDMDFKVAGGDQGVTALQMDIKVPGITFDIMNEALDQAKAGRIHILSKMAEAISGNNEISGNAPVIESFMVPKDKIREIIGAGGKVIREICDTTDAKIDITDDGQVSVSAVGREKLNAAIEMVKAIAIDPQIGGVFEGKVVKILDAGAFVNYYGNRDGFVHISEIADERIESVASALTEGQTVKVKLIGFDRGKAKLTIKNVNKEVSTENRSFKDKKKTSPRDDKKSGSRKWNNKGSNSSSDEGETTERKYFK